MVGGEVQAVLQLFERGREQIGRVIAGQQELIEQSLLTLLCGGHALVEGVPGVAKTLAVKTLARFLSLTFRRVQGTPDMMPADILGTTVFSPKTNEFSLHKGPVFTQFMLADEINRMPPRTQAALLESMEERQVTMDGAAHALDDYFTVFATQNPLEFEGTYPLPEAQLDRFLIKIRVGYPALADERSILERHHESVEAKDLELMEIEPVEFLCWPRRGGRFGRCGWNLRSSIICSRLCGGAGSGLRFRWGLRRGLRRACCWWRRPMLRVRGGTI